MTWRAVTGRLRTGLRSLFRPAGPPPSPTLRGQVFDAALALGLALIAIRAGGGGDRPQRSFEVGPPAPGTPPRPPGEPVWPPFLPIEPERSEGTILLLLLVVAPLVLRRRYPLAVLWTVLAIAAAVSENHPVLRLSFYAVVIAGYTAAVYSPYRIPALASLPVAALGYAQMQSDGTPTVPADSVPFLILVPMAVAADGLRRWKSHADADRARMSAMEHEQIEALRRATEHERARIARELHDVVTHNVSVMVIQAGAARKVMERSPEQAREALLAVEASGRSAMTELRHVMGLLTMEDDGPDHAGAPELAPQPGLDGLDALVRRVRQTGVPVDLAVTGRAGPLPSGIELTVYRLVQEALTNTVKHASGATVRVSLDYREDHVQVEVTDTGGTSGAAAATGTGRGLIGLRERLAVYGGTLQAGPRVTGGYRVRARIPVAAS
ncbi:sensor histidine kinase [Jidongwangia harbinensis]|uniref:sensor histidine kinase n=1 Tax=Jidongwangia harbinensis TaxID=2878561 RepID=UPI001CD95EDC|nr:histidine kinase [Jidongwangia harbinensis]MCA2215020.1 sensor histidine kinase [Jidongwangia harbinensis]